jgi:hypothetical protein
VGRILLEETAFGPTIGAAAAGAWAPRIPTFEGEALQPTAHWRPLPDGPGIVSYCFEHDRQVLQRFGIADTQRLSNLVECVRDPGDLASYSLFLTMDAQELQKALQVFTKTTVTQKWQPVFAGRSSGKHWKNHVGLPQPT